LTYGVALLESANGSVGKQINNHESPIEQLVLAPNSVVTVGWDGRLAWEDLREQSEVFVTEAAPRVLGIVPDGRRIAFAPSHEELAIAEIAPAPILQGWGKRTSAEAEVYGMSLSAEGTALVTAGDGGIHLWDTRARIETSTQALPAKTFWTTIFFSSGMGNRWFTARRISG
jgi:hypothetical protein